MSTAGIILSDANRETQNGLIQDRTLASLPFGGRYKVIDFTLSNMVNAGINHIGITTTRNYISLMDHVRGGNVWDLDTKLSGISFLPPFGSVRCQKEYKGWLEALQAHVGYIEALEDEYVLFTSCNYIGTLDFEKMIDRHISSGAKITALYTRHPLHKGAHLPIIRYSMNEEGFLTNVEKSLQAPADEDACYGIYCFVMNRADLLERLYATSRDGKSSLSQDLLAPMARAGEAAGFESDATLLFVEDIPGYLQSNLELLDWKVRKELFEQPQLPIITRAQDSAPGHYGDDAVVENCLIADGVKIDGTVRNSVIFRGVHIQKGAVVENCVVMRDGVIGANAKLAYTVLDRRVVVGEGRSLSGYITHPFYLERGTVI